MCIRDSNNELREFIVSSLSYLFNIIESINGKEALNLAIKYSPDLIVSDIMTVSYTHLRAHETVLDLVCRLLLEKKKK